MNAVICGLLATLLFGASTVVARYLALEGASPFLIGTIRLYAATATIFILLKILRKPLFQTNHPKLLVVVGVLGIGLNFLFYHWGLAYTTASAAVTLESTAPVFALAILYFFYSKKVSARDVASVLLAMIGIGVVMGIGTEKFSGEIIQANIGNIMEVGAAISWAIFIVVSQKCLKHEGNMETLFKVFAIAAVFLTPFALIDMRISAKNFVIVAIGLGVVMTALAYYLYYEALKKISALQGAVLFCVTPIITIAMSKILIGEEITAKIIIGTALVIIAFIALSLNEGEKNELQRVRCGV